MSQETTQSIQIPQMLLSGIPLSFNITGKQVTALTIGDIEASFILTGSTTPNGNNASANGNMLFAWQGGPSVPFGQAPVGSGAAAGNQINGTFSAQTYVVGYSVGPAVTSGGSTPVTTYPNVAATAAIPADWNKNNITYVQPDLGINAVQTSFISFSYSLPVGVNPSANGAYIGLWNGAVNPYGLAPSNTAAIGVTTNSGSAPMTGLTTITPSGTYTAALFTSGYSTTPTSLNLTTIAAVIIFNTGASLV
ncbi:MAG TPA: hypothetical protein VF006_20035 [Longimicrobium sp.]